MKEFDAVWETFSSERRLEFGGHTDPAWKGSHSVSACFILPVDADRLHERLEPMREALRPFPFVSLHPDHFAHITLAPIGFPVDEPEHEYEISWKKLGEIEASARETLSGVNSSRVTLANLNAFPAAAFVEVHDEGRLDELGDALEKIPGLGKYSMLPHLTVAYFHAPEGAEAPDSLISAIENYRDWPVGEIEVSEVRISLLDLQADYPKPETMAKIPLS